MVAGLYGGVGGGGAQIDGYKMITVDDKMITVDDMMITVDDMMITVDDMMITVDCVSRERFGFEHPKYSDALLDYGFFLLNVDAITSAVHVYQVSGDQ